MLYLQKIGCHNINLVTPTHYVPQIVEAIDIAVRKGLKIPIVYNCGGYESVETLKLLDGIVDIYMPDIKYSDNSMGLKYSGVPDYWDVVRPAVKEMWRQVGDLEIVDGLAVRGLLIRHLVLPNNIAGSAKVFEFIANEVSKNTYVNIMAQYRPYFNAFLKPELSRRITMQEYKDAVKIAYQFGLTRIELSPWF
jgi:putative pyruvate formate lyase activating enzyme